MTTATGVRIGPFEVLDRLGTGGMAEVWRARHTELDQIVAVKVMTDQRATDPRFRADFRLEVQAAARLNHPSIVRVFDYGLIGPTVDDAFVSGSPYLVMEVADRGSLDRTRPNSWGTIRRIVLQVLDALAYSHARGLVHRDVKPANLLLASTPDGRVRVKLADFGIAYVDASVPRNEGRAVGTFAYTPPEQLHGEWRRFGPPTDLYALGCLIWQLVTGAPPFSGAGPAALAMRHLVAEVPPLEPIVDVPDELEGWLRTLLEKQPTDRFQRAADAALAFQRFAERPASRTTSGDSDELILADMTTGPMDSVNTTQTYADTIVMPAQSAERSQVGSRSLASHEAMAIGGTSVKVGVGDGPNAPTPGIPTTWRRPDVAYEPGIAGLGLGLFGLREVPFVGREAERDAIWHALRLVASEGRPRAVVLRGVSGAGKSRMAQWLCQRADELGGATVVRAVHATGRRQGLRDLLERYLVTYALPDPEALRVHVLARLRRLWPGASPEFLDGETAAVVAILAPDAHARASSSERIATVGRVVSRIAATRTVLLWLDDAQWDIETIALVRHLIEQPLPVLALLTIQQEAAADLPDIEDALATLLTHSLADQLIIYPLGDEEQTELVGRLIGLDLDVCRVVSTATRGNPLFAIQLVGDWVERGALLASRDGFSLRDGVTVPQDLHALWSRRLDHICGLCGGADQQAALEAAVALGGAVRDAEWGAVLDAANIKLDERLLATLINQGMVIAEPGGWRFVHRLLAASLRKISENAGRWSALHESCAVGLARAHAAAPDSVAERRAAHFLVAGRWAAAVEPLGQAIWNRLASRDYHEAAAMIRQHASAVAAAELGDDVAGVDQMLMGVMIERSMGGAVDPTVLDVALRIAEPRGWHLQVGLAWHEKGAAAAAEARLDEALECYAQAWTALRRVDSPAERASLLESRAWVYKAKGDTESAQRDLETALDTHRAAGDKARELNTINSLAFTFLAEGDYGAARDVAEMGVDLGRELGHRGAEAGCWTTLGEIARFEGAIELARDCYRRAEELDAICGSKHVHLVRANAALLEVGAGNWDRALALFDQIEPVMVAGGEGWMSPFFTLARACCEAGQGDWACSDERWADAVQRIDAARIIERDVAWLAEIAADVAIRARDQARARRALEYALQQWDSMKDEAQSQLTRARLLDLD